LVSKGEIWFGVVKNDIIHDTGENFVKSLKKRYRYMTELYLDQLEFRRFIWVRNFKDQLMILAYCIYSLTLIGPLLESIWGYLFKPDISWFWHPIVSLAMVFVYGLAVIRRTMDKGCKVFLRRKI
jgi:hypothetical protein